MSEGVSFIPLKSYLFNKELFMDDDSDINGYDLDDEEVRRRLAKMQAVDAQVARDQEESDKGLADRTMERFARAKSIASKGTLTDRNSNIWMGMCVCVWVYVCVCVLKADQMPSLFVYGRLCIYLAS